MNRLLARPARWRRFLALLRKEFNQIRRDRRLAASLIVPPTLQILLFGFALNSDVTDLKLGILDESHTPESRELISTLTESKSFRAGGVYQDERALTEAISRSKVDAGIIVPYDFARDIQRGRQTEIAFILNAANANTASIGQGYAEGMFASYNRSLSSGIVQTQMHSTKTPVSRKGAITLTPAFLFNPGLVTNWFIVTGVFGVLLVLNGSLIASAAMVKEREAGTLEQLLMTPASTAEIIAAKITPLFVLLSGTVVLALALIHFVFAIPVRGSIFLVLAGALLCVLCGIGIGTFIATFTRSAQQSQLLSFFVNPPMASLSGSLAPIEAMPHWMQPLTLVNPIRYFGTITRGVLLKGVGIAELWPDFLALAVFALLLMTMSVSRFRKQLS